ncbi:MAG TPA: hypothetical protein DCX37_02565 [Firmicutes bacterium]|jgi:hypothetical protein|nr:hypothetical protein [Bacillota bacterium]
MDFDATLPLPLPPPLPLLPPPRAYQHRQPSIARLAHPYKKEPPSWTALSRLVKRLYQRFVQRPTKSPC